MYLNRWRMPADQDSMARARDWLHTVQYDSYFATGIKVPFTIDGEPGILLMCSSAMSTRVAKANAVSFVQSQLITEPHWLYYDLWWFKGLCLGNWFGITDALHAGHMLTYRLGDFLDQHFEKQGMQSATWRLKYCIMKSGYFRSSLRHLLRLEFSIRYWMEITVGRSYWAFRGLDMYISYQCAEQAPHPEEAWYLLNSELAPHLRYDYPPEQWWKCQVCVSVGQRPRINEWYLEVDSPVPMSRL